MIVSTASAHAVTGSDGAPPVSRRCLARRGMMHSECEAVDHVLLAPGAGAEERGRSGTEELWLLLSGEVTVAEDGAAPRSLRAGEVLLCPADSRPRLTAGAGAAELLQVSVLSGGRSALLPARRPEVGP
ncbi:DUF861 domain-containing protein [Streptomyces sp. ISL-12]|uniref:cupin domain-containing protein n=1 Tax=Streptomyces sp. ISL-12 TaxID=2819177 RepID=UPI001BEABF9F|nr:cupin domain-containing protein [Streptomyces sp. ISL-12]MBT2413703.1 DUF861 domain-containing protein [Streptomyces sp. ISL-12]